MPKMIGICNEVIRTTYGHAVSFKEGEETNVPDVKPVVKQCVAAGHKLVKEVKPVRKPEPVPETPPSEKKVVGRPAAVKTRS
jgi:hypothetical protein